MKLKKLVRYLSLTTSLLAGSSYADVSPYFTVQEVGVNQTGVLKRAQREITSAAMSQNGDWIAANAQFTRMPFDVYDINQPFTFGYGCQYSTYICSLAWEGSQTNGVDNGDGFYDYRTSLASAFNGGSYTSYFLSMVNASTSLSSATATPSSSFTNVSSLGSSLLSKFYAFDTSSANTHDTHITSMTADKETIGGISAYWVTGYDSSPSDSTMQIGFVESLDGSYRISLTPYYTSTNGGVSAGYTFGHDSSNNLYVAGLSSTELVTTSSSNNFSYCYKDGDSTSSNSGYYQYCSGFKTQAEIWPLGNISFSSNEANVSGTRLSSDWLNNKSNTNYAAGALGMNNEGTIAGYSGYSDSSSTLGTRARAVLYTYDGSTPTRYIMSGTDLIGADNDDNIRDQWAVDITDPINNQVYVVGNERYTSSKASSAHNQAVNFFISQLSNTTNGIPNSGVGTVQWPLKDNPFTGASNQVNAIDHSTGLAVGWRDASSETQTAYQGIRREHVAFLFDVPSYMSDTSNPDSYEWSLNSLTCYESGTTATRPFYRIEHANSIHSDGSNLYVLASGYKYASKADYVDKLDPTPVILKLTHSGISAPVNSALSSCPDYSATESKYSRKGADSVWLTLLLIPVIFVRVFTKRAKENELS
ncbi:DUF3466 family protein [Celerinatantimonas yamalensis]|uniref:DUF3466 family protein n=1 Tax=Celerinatantimonas yamalensis TaxID=559956 RepID=A0ABW9G3I4_9GAMM